MKSISFLILCAALVSNFAFAEGKTTSVICSTDAPKIEGFELVRVTRKKDRATGSYDVASRDFRSGAIRFQGSYDVELKRLKAKLIQVDEDGEEVSFLGSVDGYAAAGEHLRAIFASPAGPIELVCNVVAH